ncbi:helix-turn-helix transcriptional regulator [Desulfogranum mediterraneum]|uniref:helix-turn-helix transcriptional regulator n=1 Tax=Desulfogranum mediterraneum TaxID=160661 RepID=UPI00041E122B|nr:WYL domain-containing protein [Desulfogranum mediterraneum]
MSLLERIYFFHSRIQEASYPNASDLAAEFEVSTATAHRDINYLRDRLLAPLAYSPQHTGYYYSQENFRLPFEESAEIMVFLGILSTIAGELGLEQLPELSQLQQKLGALAFPGKKNLEQYIHCEWIETEPVDNTVFQSVLTGLLDRLQLSISYADGSPDTPQRTLDPLKLLHYQGRWYLYAWCHLRRARRLFQLSRINTAQALKDQTSHAMAADDSSLTGVFGIFKGAPIGTVTLRFSGHAARTVRRQHWHPEQELIEIPEGVQLTLPVADEREVMMKVLQFGSQAEVIRPARFRRKISAELAKMSERYTLETTP